VWQVLEREGDGRFISAECKEMALFLPSSFAAASFASHS